MSIAFKSKCEITWATTGDNIVGRKALWVDLSFLLDHGIKNYHEIKKDYLGIKI